MDIGALTPSDLVEGVTQQLYDVIFSLFHYRTGTYALELAPFSTLEMVTLAIEIPAVIFMGMCRRDGLESDAALVGVPGLRLRTCLLQPRLRGGPGTDTRTRSTSFESAARGCRWSPSWKRATCPSSRRSVSCGSSSPSASWSARTRGARPHVDAGLQPEALVDQYNDVYAFIHHHLMAAGVREQELAPLGDGLASAHPILGSNQSDLVHFGRLDVDALLFALRAIPEPDRPQSLQAFLEEALYALVLEADRRLPQGQRDAVKAYIRRKADSSQGG